MTEIGSLRESITLKETQHSRREAERDADGRGGTDHQESLERMERTRVRENPSLMAQGKTVRMTMTGRQSDQGAVSPHVARIKKTGGLSECSARLIEIRATSQGSLEPSAGGFSSSVNGWNFTRRSVEKHEKAKHNKQAVVREEITDTDKPLDLKTHSTVVNINETIPQTTSLREGLSPQDQIGVDRGNRVRATLQKNSTSWNVVEGTRGNGRVTGPSSRESTQVLRNSKSNDVSGATHDTRSHNQQQQSVQTQTRLAPSTSDVSSSSTPPSSKNTEQVANTTALIPHLVTSDTHSSNHSLGEQTNKTSNITYNLNLSTASQTLSRRTMGHNNNPDSDTHTSTTDHPNAWNVPQQPHSHHSHSHHNSDSDKMESSTQRTENDDDDTTIRSFDSTGDATASSLTHPRYGATGSGGGYSIPESHLATHTTVLGTPSTTSTAPSTDDASWSFDTSAALGTLGLSGPGGGGGSGAGAAGGGSYQHRRVPSWEGLTHSFHHHMNETAQQQQQQGYNNNNIPQAQGAWGPSRVSTHPQQQQQQQQQQQRVATFRGENQGYPPTVPVPVPAPAPSTNRWQQQQQPLSQQQQRYADTQLPFLPPGDARGAVYHPAPRPSSSGGAGGAYNPYQMQQQPPQQQQQHDRRQGYGGGPPLPPTLATPPRTGTRNQRLATGPTASPHRGGGGSGLSSSVQQSPGGGGGGARSSSEILKTLLRKKACLYEPDTSRAVTLITWLVGRYLALENGFFSRQQLQAGVHSCIANKIESGVITRTKVNRCMQIILNSCFHYIIPRPDGTEENGASFCQAFAKEVSDDEFLLRVLPAPWNDMVVDKDAVLKASFSDEVRQAGGKGQSPTQTPQSSPKLSSVNGQSSGKLTNSPGADSNEPGADKGDETKRAVLLCFNENVRCAEDVFRCHNEFIRDTAHASNLQLSSPEWRLFFGKEAASAPYLWGCIGIPLTHREQGKDSGSSSNAMNKTDALGVMTSNEAAVFRTSWCAKRYDHNHELCGFAHNAVNGGWLRRNPSQYNYKDEMCPSVSKLSHEVSDSKVLVLNECPHGVDCPFAHSTEEILYHPNRYKERVCSMTTRPGGCRLGDVCCNFHPLESYRFPKKSDMRSPRHSRQSGGGGGGNKGVSSSSSSSNDRIPSGAPVLYASPAPVSSFDRQILTPGLKSLYRRHAAVARSLIRTENRECFYSYFGDDDGLFKTGSSSKEKKTATGAPNSTDAPSFVTTKATNTIIGSPTSSSPTKKE